MDGSRGVGPVICRVSWAGELYRRLLFLRVLVLVLDLRHSGGAEGDNRHCCEPLLRLVTARQPRAQGRRSEVHGGGHGGRGSRRRAGRKTAVGGDAEGVAPRRGTRRGLGSWSGCRLRLRVGQVAALDQLCKELRLDGAALGQPVLDRLLGHLGRDGELVHLVLPRVGAFCEGDGELVLHPCLPADVYSSELVYVLGRSLALAHWRVRLGLRRRGAITRGLVPSTHGGVLRLLTRHSPSARAREG
mmetsp:Transcript_18943/g.50940  ORF Transcript_18943/g.50940 Transcript_18943/m.50940 type:complete len:245 (-) Transcript_18943:136-870(-)